MFTEQYRIMQQKSFISDDSRTTKHTIANLERSCHVYSFVDYVSICENRMRLNIVKYLRKCRRTRSNALN